MPGSKSNQFELQLMLHIFNNADIMDGVGGTTPWVRAGVSPGSFKIALYTAEVGETGSGGTTNEATYTGYARQSVVRSGAGWTVSGGGVVTNAAVITFPACTAGTNTITHFGILSPGTAGQEYLLYWGSLTANLIVSPGITPQFPIGSITITED